ncbi:MAG: DUF480 domain-containing protein [Planctomycetota bacterium]
MSDAERLQLRPDERRVLGTLAEKGLTTPEQYPLTRNALLAGCNQKSNRDPITHYEEEEVAHALDSLRSKGLVTVVMSSAGRTERYRQELGSKLQISAHELAILTELLLRGAQTEGDLRGRASRMRPVADLPELRELFKGLRHRDPPLVIRLSPEGMERGVRVTHNFYLDTELEPLLAAEREGPTAAAPRVAASSGLSERLQVIEQRLEELGKRLEAIETRIGPGAPQCGGAAPK